MIKIITDEFLEDNKTVFIKRVYFYKILLFKEVNKDFTEDAVKSFSKQSDKIMGF